MDDKLGTRSIEASGWYDEENDRSLCFTVVCAAF